MSEPGAELLRRARRSLERGLERLPWERASFLGVAAVVGIYAGIAAGLFAQAIRFAQVVLFGDLFRTLGGGGGEVPWIRLFERRLAESRWHLEFAVVAALLFAAGTAVERLGARRQAILPLFEAHRIRAVAEAGALGLALYYPLVVLRAFNGAFGQPEGGLYALLLATPRPLWLLAPAVGALLGGWVVRYVSPESSGHGVVEAIEAVHVRGQSLRGRVAIWKALAAGLVIGSGGSAGREGPVVHIGGAVGSALGRSMALPRRRVVVLIACGAGAGIAASFQAPFAGALFALEIVLAGFAASQIAPIVLACVIATATSRALLGGGTDLRPVSWTLAHPAEIGVYLILGVVAGLCGVVYARALGWGEELFAGRRGGGLGLLLARLSPPWKAAAGGLAVGALGLLGPRALGTGLESMNAALGGELALGALCLALLVKLLATSLTLGSGSPGGSFFPAVFLGAMLGGAFGHLAQAVAPGAASAPSSYAAVGMGAVVAGATVAPLTGVMMMVELTGSWQILAPLLISCCTAAAVVQGVLGGSIYQLGARRRGLMLGQGGHSLRDLSVLQALEPAADTAALLADPHVPRLHQDDDLEEALRRLARSGSVAALVFPDAEPQAAAPAPLGVVTRHGILDAWRKTALPPEPSEED